VTGWSPPFRYGYPKIRKPGIPKGSGHAAGRGKVRTPTAG